MPIRLERTYIGSVEQANAIAAAADPAVTRPVMAEFYRDCIIAHRIATEFKPPMSSAVAFTVVNAAILKRWPKGLLWIKTRAWRLLKQMDADGDTD